MRQVLYLILTLGIISCKSKDTSLPNETFYVGTRDTVDLKEKPKDTIKLIVSYPELLERIDKQNSTPRGNYYKLIISSDSTCRIEWGNVDKPRVTDGDFHYHIARRFNLVWENDKFIVLRARTGSDWWIDLFLPIGNDPSEFVIENCLTFDKKRNLVVSEYPSPDTVMEIHNLTNKNRQFILERNECGSAIIHYCIDSIAFTEKGLYYKWTTPHTFDDNKKYFERRVAVKI